MRVSLSQMLLVVTLLSVLCLFFFVVPPPFDVIVLLGLSFGALPAVVIVGSVYSRGETRAFFLGAGLGAGIPYVAVGFYFMLALITSLSSILDGNDLEEIRMPLKIILGGLWGMALLSAMGSWLTYRWVKSDESSTAPVDEGQNH